MAKRRVSLAELQRADEDSRQPTPPTPEVEPDNSDWVDASPVEAMDIGKEKSANPISDSRNPKSDFVKVSVTLPPEIHESLLDISRQRRRAKQPYMISDLVREALAQWLVAASIVRCTDRRT